jgi:signal transduction histidine kinase
MLFQLAPPTVPLRDIPTYTTTEAAIDTKSVSKLATPPTVPWPAKREQTTGGREGDQGASPPVPHASRSPATDLSVLDSLDEVVWSVAPDGQVVFFLAGAVERTYGRRAADLQDQPAVWLDAVPHCDRAELIAALERLPDTDSFELEHRLETPTGPVRWVVSRGRLVRNPDGTALRVDGTTTDVTARTRVARSLAGLLERIGPAIGVKFLAKAVAQLGTGFDARAAVVVVPDVEAPSRCRTAAAWLDGRAAEPFTFDAAGPFTRDVLAGVSKLLPARARDRFPTDELLTMLRAESAVAEPLTDDRGALIGFVAVIDDRPRTDAADLRTILRALAPRVSAELTRPADASERMQELDARLRAAEERVAEAEEQLRQARRLESVGRLVAGVAHDFNNLLTVISGNADLVRDQLPAHDPLRDAAELIASTAQTAAGVVRQLLASGKPHSGGMVAVDLNAAVRSAERLLRRMAGNTVTLDLALATTVPLIHADPGQFDQVLLNLVANARDAIAESGTVTVRTAVVEVNPDRQGWPDDLPAGVFAALTVTDTGTGMTEQVKDRIFDPFFTTKAGRGTGLGLSTVRDIVRGAGGHIEVESSPEWGTSVRVYWPRAEPPAVVPVPRSAVGARGETVLVVQDDEWSRNRTVTALQQAGYRVLAAGDDEAGEDRARQYAGPIHLLVTHPRVQEIGERDLADRLRSMRPRLKALYLSGAPPPDPTDTTCLTRPSSPNDLLAAVRRALDG